MSTSKVFATASRCLTVALLIAGTECLAQPQLLPLDSVVEQEYLLADVVQLSARKLLEGDRVRGLRSLVVAGNVLALGIRNGPGAAHVTLSDRGRNLSPIVLQGIATIEALWGLSVDQNGRDIWAFDPQRSALTRIVINQNRAGSSAEYGAQVHLDPGAPLTRAVARGGEIWASGILERGRIVRFDSDGKLIGLLGPPPLTDRNDPSLASQVYVGVLAKKPNGGLAAIACRLAGRVEIIDSTGRSVLLAQVPHAFPPLPRFTEFGGKKYAQYRADRYLGYIDVQATDRYVYALFSGRTRVQARDRGSSGRFVHVFDWDGRRIAVLKLPYDAHTMFATADDSQLYFGHSLLTEHHLAVAELSEALRPRRATN